MEPYCQILCIFKCLLSTSVLCDTHSENKSWIKLSIHVYGGFSTDLTILERKACHDLLGSDYSDSDSFLLCQPMKYISLLL